MGGVSKMFLFLLALIACGGAGWHFYSKNGGTHKTVLADLRALWEEKSHPQGSGAGSPDSPETIAAAYAQDFSRRSYTLVEAGRHPELWPREVLVKPRLPGMPRGNMPGKLVSVEPQYLLVSVQGKVLHIQPEQTNFDEKLRQNIYMGAYDSKLRELAGSSAELVRPMQSRTDYSVPAITSYVRRNVLPTQTPVLGNWSKVEEARYHGKPCYSVEVTVGLARDKRIQPRRFRFYLNGNKILWTDFERL